MTAGEHALVGWHTERIPQLETINLLRFEVSIALIEISIRVGEILKFSMQKLSSMRQIQENFPLKTDGLKQYEKTLTLPSDLSIFPLALTLGLFYFGEALRMKEFSC